MARPWDPLDEADRPLPIYSYPSEYLSAFEKLKLGRGWTVHVTNNVRKLPSYGDHVIAIVLEDESARYPLYANRVRAVFKTYGIDIAFPRFRGNPELDAVSVLHWCALASRRLRFTLRRYTDIALRHGQNIFDIPVGYLKQVDMPNVPMSRRAYDVSFVGSVEHRPYRWYSAKRYIRSPKVLSRQSMLFHLSAFAASNPNASVHMATTPTYGDSLVASADTYSKLLANTKICLVPRGASFETFRWFEALRAGCVIICEQLPHRRYYDHAPCIRVRDWREMPNVAEGLLADELALENLGERARKWWEQRCSGPAVAQYIANALGSSELSGA